ncbi:MULTISPECIES: DJ-1/PfpI family protein [unclassified Pseudomonas]|jgi:putative intracellular protease/amidase|uniref:DJ-1/PfpI family protein n=1 Tax=unclassified Pseudomonas TaxID=196821 RepID=UPI000C84C52F|nr:MULTISPECIES: DJ-1/PfpI family protein [unclassified Pseudomonas]MDX9669618.1 type 1 glutamine amidotransferase domain-containing protein [Pseudomonas sp. P8_250]PMQ07124.1 Pyridoxal 5'-phosphate synthase subunit PdxT [Pseudomonas sp. AD21]WPN36348.1 type 1 glutamine amidotransferase domain-containing protein [Pseudomonas sp. P8_139]WPN41851.1 type 1 glutamine amidotransferase domain-containing protein [Pseudomonas sp. P8_229]
MILILLPCADYDPTESSVPWQALRDAGIEARFATPQGLAAYADPRLVSTGFGPLNPMLMTRRADLHSYAQMIDSPAFLQPLAYADVDPAQFDGLLIPGGHAKGMRSLLESAQARDIALHFFNAQKPVAAVCHGVLLLARTLDPDTGRSVLFGRKVTALLAATMELPAWLMTAAWLGRYYRTYKQTVEAEVTAALSNTSDFVRGPRIAKRDSAQAPQTGFVVRDGQLLTARWPGDCHRFAAEWVTMLQGRYPRFKAAADTLHSPPAAMP